MFENLHSGLYHAMINKFIIILSNSFDYVKKFYCISNICLRTNRLNYQSLRGLPGLKAAENNDFYEFFERKNYCYQFYICTHIFILQRIFMNFNIQKQYEIVEIYIQGQQTCSH